MPLSTRIRPAVARALRKIPFAGSERWACPRRAFSTARSWFESNHRPRGAEWIDLDPAATVERPEPITLDEKVHWILARDRTDANWPTFVLKIPGGRVFGRDGTVVTPDGSLLGDISRESNRPPHRHSAFDRLRLPPVENFSGTLAILTVGGGDVYFHWMMDCLPRLDLLRRAGIALSSIDGFVVNGFDRAFQKETLARLGIPESKVLVARYERHWKADQLLVPSLAGTSGNMLRHNCDFLRREFLPQHGAGAAPAAKRIYLSRSDAVYRRVTNEAQVARLLAEQGFERLATGQLSVAEQARIFSQACAIVAPHGAGLTNIVYCSPGAKLFELFAPRYVNSCYYALSHRVGVPYHYLLGEGTAPPEGIDPHDIGADITVDTTKLARLLEKGLGSGRSASL